MLYESPNFRLEANDLVATLWLDLRSSSDHCLTLPQLNEFSLLIDRVAQLKFLDVLIIRSGAQSAFCRGFDVETWQSLATPTEVASAVHRGQELTRKISELPMATIALVEGRCEAGGLEIALSCDSIVATRSGEVGFVPGFVERGIIPCWGGSHRLVRRLGGTAAMSWVNNPESLNSEQASDSGLVDRLIPESRLEISLRYLVDRISRGRSIRPGFFANVLRIIRSGITIRPSSISNIALAEAIEELFSSEHSALAESHVIERRWMSRLLLDEVESRNTLEFAAESELLLQQKERLNFKLFRRIGAIGDTANSSVCADLKFRGVPISHLSNQSEWSRQGLESSLMETPELVLVHGEDPEEIRRDLAKLAGRLNARTIVALTGNSVTVQEASQGSPYPSMIVGLHRPDWVVASGVYEISVNDETSPDAIARLEAWLIGLKCVPLRSVDRPGHVANMMLLALLSESVSLVSDGFSPREIDQIALQLGFARGPLEWCDSIGFDTLTSLAAQIQLARRDDFARELLFEKFRSYQWNGKSTGQGFYRYGFWKRENELARIALWQGNRLARNSNYINDLASSCAEAGDRLVYRLINQAAMLAEDSDAEMSKAIDRISILTVGWPKSLGGPLKLTDTTGLLRIVNRLHELRIKHGERFRPAPELLYKTEHGLLFTDSEAEQSMISGSRPRLAG